MMSLWDAAISAGYHYESDSTYAKVLKNHCLDADRYSIVPPRKTLQEGDEQLFYIGFSSKVEWAGYNHSPSCATSALTRRRK